jgi:hypothetical protein
VTLEQARRSAERADEDAAALAVVLAMITAPVARNPESPRSVWADPAHRWRLAVPRRHGWWASGQPS